jgi:hypothetical protein
MLKPPHGCAVLLVLLTLQRRGVSKVSHRHAPLLVVGGEPLGTTHGRVGGEGVVAPDRLPLLRDDWWWWPRGGVPPGPLVESLLRAKLLQGMATHGNAESDGLINSVIPSLKSGVLFKRMSLLR